MKTILVLGDSHTRVFLYANQFSEDYKFSVCEVGGATAQGAVNMNSKTNALPIFKSKMKTACRYDYIGIMLGEVDCGFLVYVRSKRYGISIDEQLSLSIANLFTFIEKDVEGAGYVPSQIIVYGAVLPTIRDGTNTRYLGGARAEVDVSQYDRTLLTLKYNDELKRISARKGYKYIDITDNILGDDGVVISDVLNDNPYDHHLSNDRTYAFWLDKHSSCLD